MVPPNTSAVTDPRSASTATAGGRVSMIELLAPAIAIRAARIPSHWRAVSIVVASPSHSCGPGPAACAAATAASAADWTAIRPIPTITTWTPIRMVKNTPRKRIATESASPRSSWLTVVELLSGELTEPPSAELGSLDVDPGSRGLAPDLASALRSYVQQSLLVNVV